MILVLQMMNYGTQTYFLSRVDASTHYLTLEHSLPTNTPSDNVTRFVGLGHRKMHYESFAEPGRDFL